MANIKKLKANGQDIVPITHEQAVLDSNGVTLDSKLNAINNAISRLENGSTSNATPLDFGVKMIAHRGFSNQAPENTIPAYELAGMKGYWGAECDIQQTSDGYFILMHDETVDRTTNGTGNIANMTLEQIKSLTVDHMVGFTDLRVPTLEEYLICCKKYNLVPVIEIKASIDIQAFLQIIRDFGMEDKCVVISFSDTTLIELRSLSSIIKIQLVQSVDTFKGLDFYEQHNFGVDIHFQQSFVTEENIKEAHRRGIEVNTWTVDDANDMEHLINLNIDYITTNWLTTPSNEGNRIYQLEQEILELRTLIEAYHNITVDDKTINILTIQSCTARNNTSPYPASFTIGEGARAFSSIHSVNGYTKISTTFDSSKYKVTPVPFNSNKMVLGDLGWSTPDIEYNLPSDTAYVCFYFGTIDNSNFTSDLLNEIKSNIVGHLS